MRPGRRSMVLLPALVALLAAAGAGAPIGEELEPSPRDPSRPETGRDRAARRRRAQELAKELGLDVELVYQALGRGESEAEIRAAKGSS